MAKLPISVQLYTVRSLTEKDFAGTMKSLAKIGYRNVELAGFGNLKSAGEARKALDDAGLKVSGAHVAISLLGDINKALDEADVLGNENLIVPYLTEEWRTTAGYTKVAAELTKAAPAVIARGKTLSYHNHDFEFQKLGDTTGFDIIWNNTDPNLVKSELDVYWVNRAGIDPVSYINKLGSRLILLHLKDANTADKTKFAPVGTGSLDFKAISEAGARLGVKYGIVEQDDCYGQDPLENVRVSLDNLRKLGIA